MSHHSPGTFNLVLDALLLAGTLIWTITPFVHVCLLRVIREELASQRLALSKMANDAEDSALVRPNVVSQPEVSLSPREATPADKGRTAKAIAAKTVIISRATQQPTAREPGTSQPNVAPQSGVKLRPNEVRRADKGSTARAIMAKTVLIAARAVKQPRVVEKLYVAKGGENIGEIDVPTIRAMLKSGELSARDHFYEINKQIWASFDGMPGFCS